jgi:hypothetical protein
LRLYTSPFTASAGPGRTNLTAACVGACPAGVEGAAAAAAPFLAAFALAAGAAVLLGAMGAGLGSAPAGAFQLG